MGWLERVHEPGCDEELIPAMMDPSLFAQPKLLWDRKLLGWIMSLDLQQYAELEDGIDQLTRVVDMSGNVREYHGLEEHSIFVEVPLPVPVWQQFLEVFEGHADDILEVEDVLETFDSIPSVWRFDVARILDERFQDVLRAQDAQFLLRHPIRWWRAVPWGSKRYVLLGRTSKNH